MVEECSRLEHFSKSILGYPYPSLGHAGFQRSEPTDPSSSDRQIVCISSIAQLEEVSGVKGITDLHRESIDHIVIPSKQGNGDLRRIEEVFDCWFESGR